MSSAENVENRAMSSVFIGNVPHDVTEDQLKDLFSEAGAIINFRLFYDKNSGKPKGFAFCEYKEPEIAISATRNLGGYELKGHSLRVDVATSENCRQELERLQGAIAESVTEASEATPEKAPEEISKAVASLPADQMFELMKQMKMCIENNPSEARNLLLQNPQLAYALLQAQVIMRIVDPDVAVKILNRPIQQTVPAGNVNPESKPATEQMPTVPTMNETPAAFSGMPSSASDSTVTNAATPMQRNIANPHGRPPMERLPMIPGSGPLMPNQFGDQDLRNLGDQDLRQLPPPMVDRDMRPPPVMLGDKDMRQPMGDQDFRTLGVPVAMPESRPFDPRFRNMPVPDASRPLGPNFDRGRPGNVDPRTAYEARNTSGPVRVEDPRKASMSAAALNSRLSAAGPALRNLGTNMPNIGPSHPAMAAAAGASAPTGPEDQEKAALILQVLQLTDQQIAMLPPEQRQSIMVLKEQLARSQMT